MRRKGARDERYPVGDLRSAKGDSRTCPAHSSDYDHGLPLALGGLGVVLGAVGLFGILRLGAVRVRNGSRFSDESISTRT